MDQLNFNNIRYSLTATLFTIRLNVKIWRITQPRFAIRQKLAASGIICEWTYEKVGWVIRLESKSNTCILDEYGKY